MPQTDNHIVEDEQGAQSGETQRSPKQGTHYEDKDGDWQKEKYLLYWIVKSECELVKADAGITWEVNVS